MNFGQWFPRIVTIAAVVSLAACSSVKLDEVTPADGANGTNGAAAGRAGANGVYGDPLDPNSPLAKQRSVYFDLDSYVVKPEYQGTVSLHAGYLKANPGRKVLLQGNTDERGTTEYNLALGQKRAEAVLRALSLLGVPANQAEAVSFGKEKPKAQGHDESAWAENRRADFAY